MTANLTTTDELDSLTKDPKATEDFSTQVEEALASAEVLVKAGRQQEAIEELLTVEHRARQAADGASVSKLTQRILQICKDKGQWDEINEYVAVLSKKRNQLKRAIVDMVQLVISWIEDTPTQAVKLALINNLSQVTEGKIFVEVERARLVMILAKIKEAEGDIESAAGLLQEVQVETFGAMERREKSEYILEQMRIVLAKGDFIRCQIISKKINVKLLEAEDFQDIKLKFYEYMIKYYLHEVDYLNVAKSYFALYSTPIVQADAEKWRPILESYVIHLVLTPSGNEPFDLLNRVKNLEMKKLEKLPTFKRMVLEFLKFELMTWPLPYESDIRSHQVFTSTTHEGGDARWTLLRTRVLQHNIQSLAKYYSRMHLNRVSEFLGVDMDEVESRISELVTSGQLQAKMNRPSGIVTFGGRKETVDKLNSWSTDIAKAMDLLEESCHLVEKEKMVHNAKQKKMQAVAK